MNFVTIFTRDIDVLSLEIRGITASIPFKGKCPTRFDAQL